MSRIKQTDWTMKKTKLGYTVRKWVSTWWMHEDNSTLIALEIGNEQCIQFGTLETFMGEQNIDEFSTEEDMEGLKSMVTPVLHPVN